MRIIKTFFSVSFYRSLISLVLLTGVTIDINAQTEDCKADGGVGFICGLQNAEDLVLVPDTDWIIASGMAPGVSMYLINARTREAAPFYPGDSPRNQQDMQRYADCPGAPDITNFITHGLNLRRGQGQHSTLNVVSHGAREAIEIFAVGAGVDRPVLTWTGCVLMPAGLAARSAGRLTDG